MKIKNIPLLTLVCVVGFLIVGVKSACAWKSPGVNKNSTKTAYSCIYDGNHHTCDLAMSNMKCDTKTFLIVNA